jgi:hypothetical protein
MRRHLNIWTQQRSKLAVSTSNLKHTKKDTDPSYPPLGIPQNAYPVFSTTTCDRSPQLSLLMYKIPQLTSPKTKQSDLPENTLLLTMDVVSLYTNIPHDEGIEACKEAWDTRVDPDIPATYLVKLLTHVLKLNNFEFNDQHYLQVNGTAMGTKMAPSYANIFTGKLETDLLHGAPNKPLSWLRFIDDIESK